MSISNSDPTGPCEPKPWPHEPEAKGIHVVLGFNVDLTLLRKQKRALIETYEGTAVNYEQEDAAEGLLNLIDFIQDSVLEQGLATEEEVCSHDRLNCSRKAQNQPGELLKYEPSIEQHFSPSRDTRMQRPLRLPSQPLRGHSERSSTPPYAEGSETRPHQREVVRSERLSPLHVD
jgi:hypothetical protein